MASREDRFVLLAAAVVALLLIGGAGGSGAVRPSDGVYRISVVVDRCTSNFGVSGLCGDVEWPDPPSPGHRVVINAREGRAGTVVNLISTLAERGWSPDPVDERSSPPALPPVKSAKERPARASSGLKLAARPTISERKLVSLINKQRTSRNLRPLKIDARLSAAAEKQARYQSGIGRMTHAGPGGETFADRIQQAGYVDTPIGENVARQAPNLKLLVRRWMRSPAHRENILLEGYRRTGISYVDGYWVQTFGG